MALLAIFAAGICGYAHMPVLAWIIAAMSLATLSWAQHFGLVRRGAEAGMEGEVGEVLMRSLANAVIATGGCYWFGVFMRLASPL